MSVPTRRTLVGLAGWAAILVVLVLLPGRVERGTQEVLLNLLIWVGVAQAWNLIGGVGGQLSLGHSVFVGAGGYTVAMLVIKGGTGWAAGLLGGALLAALVAWVLSFPLLRLSGVYFTIGSSAVALMALAWMVTWEWTGESRGLNIPLEAVPDRAVKFRVVAAVAVLTCVAVSLVVRSSFGLRLMAVRDDEGAAAALGVSAVGVKRWALVLSAFLTGLVGGTVALNQVSIEPNSMFGLKWVVTALVMVVIGGMGTVWGPVVGAFVVYYLLDRSLEDQPVVQALLSGVLVIAVIVAAPGGVVGLVEAAAARVAGRRTRSRAAGPTAAKITSPAGEGVTHG
ncbi:branched-chain amino acid ABC transporter permease [Kineosporia sp. R_H_3]|uniref:branched-chain amino acid ABC transporter permease n=1 Tax=Kineosporia sp. R_H_3 TaxID=1961848 RepID=UPI000B4BD245|nr:branched-chain amino acid ABC transporter permease [Kineosporia sp. R_H_3]